MTGFECKVSQRLRYLPRSLFVSRRVGVPMNEQEVNLGLVPQYGLEFSLQNRASTLSGITYRGKRNCRADHYRRATIRQ